MYKEQSPALEKHKDYEVIKSYKLPLRIKDGSISSFDITYFEFPSGKYHVLSKGEVTGSENVPVRINSECIWGRFGSAQCDCNEQYEEAKRVIAEEGLDPIQKFNFPSFTDKRICIGNSFLQNNLSLLA